jgi:two-component SAPR family response regulator
MKVLLINDCKFESIIMKDTLISLNKDVKVTDEYSALNEIKEYEPDIVIANLIMKDTTGYELIKDIKNQDNGVKCILSSSNPIDKDDFDDDIDYIIHTPIDKEEMKEVINKLFFTDNTEKKQDIFEELMKKKAAYEAKNSIKFCPYCGKKFEEKHEGIKFCCFCGEKL